MLGAVEVRQEYASLLADARRDLWLAFAVLVPLAALLVALQPPEVVSLVAKMIHPALQLVRSLAHDASSVEGHMITVSPRFSASLRASSIWPLKSLISSDMRFDQVMDW